MPRALADIMTELNSVYDPQRNLYNSQLQAADPQLEAEQKGLMAQKEDSFRQITDQANRRGMFYSGLPIAEEQRYTGTQFLPAVANLRSKYATQKFGLSEALNKLAVDQRMNAQNIWDTERDLEEKQRQFDQQMAAQRDAEARARASAGSGGAAGFSFGSMGGGAQKAPAQASGYDFRGLVAQNNPYVFKDLLNDINQTNFGGKGSYGQLAGWLEGNIGKIPSGSAADLALRNIFLKQELDPRRQTLGAINKAVGSRF